VGRHPLQLYSMGTPNGQKVTIMLEELLEAGYAGAEYDAWYVGIFDGDQFTSGFVDINPNSKIPALVDTTAASNEGNRRMFESGSILLQLADKFDGYLLPSKNRGEVLNWLFWQMGSAPFLGGGFGHFYRYAPVKLKYPIDRFAMEVKRQLDVLEKQLQKTNQTYIAGDEYTIADIAIWPWYGNLVLGNLYDDSDVFLNVREEYPSVVSWAKRVLARPAVQRGRKVNKKAFLKERHDASDFEQIVGKTDTLDSLVMVADTDDENSKKKRPGDDSQEHAENVRPGKQQK